MRRVETNLRDLKRVLQALKELADELALLILAWAGFVSLVLWLWRR
jgi:hypothetical protein